MYFIILLYAFSPVKVAEPLTRNFSFKKISKWNMKTVFKQCLKTEECVFFCRPYFGIKTEVIKNKYRTEYFIYNEVLCKTRREEAKYKYTTIYFVVSGYLE